MYTQAYTYSLTAKSLQSCPTLCNPIDGSPPGSPIPGILQARTLEWVAISFSNVWKWKVKVKSLSCVRPSVTPWTAAFQAPPSKGFSRQEYWSGVPLPSPYSLTLFIKSLQTGVIFLWDYETLLTILYWDNQNSTSLFYQLTSNQENRSHLEYFKQKLKQEIGYTDAAIGERLIKKWWCNLEFRLRRQPQLLLCLRE